MKKVLALLLAVLMLLSTLTLAACGGDGGDGKETKDTKDTKDTADSGKDTSGSGSTDESKETGESKYLDHLNETYDFGETIHFLTRGSDVLIENYEEEDGEYNSTNIVSVAVFKRWKEVEERLNVTLDGQFGLGNGEISSGISNDVKANSNDFDIAYGHMKFNGSQATTGNLFNLAKLPNVDLSQNYYAQDYVKKFTYKDYTHWVTGDITTGYIDEMVGVFVYDPLWEERFGSVDNLFEIVETGKWTLAKAAEVTADAYVDDGDTIKNEGDTYGWVSAATEWVKSAVMSGAGYNYTIPASGGKYKLDLTSAENEAIFKEFKLGFSENPTQTDEFVGMDCIKMFSEGRALLWHQTLSNMSSDELRNLSVGYSIVPMPKAFEDQDYRTPSYDGITIVGVLASLRAHKDRYEAVGATFEALSAAGKKYVTEAQFETGLRAKYAKNAGSYRCLSIIREAGYSDFAFCWTGALNEIDKFLANSWRVPTLASVASQQAQYEKLLTTLYSNLNTVAKNDPD